MPCLIFCASSGKGIFPSAIRFGMFATSYSFRIVPSCSVIELVWSKKRHTANENWIVVCCKRLRDASDTGIEAGCWIERSVNTTWGSSRRGSCSRPKKLNRCRFRDARRSSLKSTALSGPTRAETSLNSGRKLAPCTGLKKSGDRTFRHEFGEVASDELLAVLHVVHDILHPRHLDVILVLRRRRPHCRPVSPPPTRRPWQNHLPCSVANTFHRVTHSLMLVAKLKSASRIPSLCPPSTLASTLTCDTTCTSVDTIPAPMTSVSYAMLPDVDDASSSWRCTSGSSNVGRSRRARARKRCSEYCALSRRARGPRSSERT